MTDAGREGSVHPTAAAEREWLVTNGLGGYAAGTVAGLLTRRYHGLLVAALQPPLGRTVLLSKLEETVAAAGSTYPLYTNRWQRSDAPADPPGFRHIERFRLEGTTPVWIFALGDARLEKRIWMEQGRNVTYVAYRHAEGPTPLQIGIKALVTFRDAHATTRAGNWQMTVEPVGGGIRVTPYAGAVPLYLLTDRAGAEPRHEWYRDHALTMEAGRGLEALEDLLYAAQFTATLEPGETLTLVAGTEANLDVDATAAAARQQAREEALLAAAGLADEPPWIQQLALAADQFVVRRTVNGEGGRSVIAGYHWFGDWGRDTMIALPGLTLATGRAEIAAQILRTYARFVDQGMLPNRFPDGRKAPEYNTVDATLWYFEAIRAYYQATDDQALVADLFPVLKEMVTHHLQGTRHGIATDPADGLLRSGEPGVQLTWMDAKLDDWVVTPRTGKAVEVNALWYHALRTMAEFAELVGGDPRPFTTVADRAAKAFPRFWNENAGYCFDVIDGPDGDDPALRPNQLLAVALHHSPLPEWQQQAVVEACTRHLLTPMGLRTLAPGHPDYAGRYEGDPRSRDGAYHQGTVWPWLIGPFVAAHLRVYGDGPLARSFLEPFADHLADQCLGTIGEIADGDPPHTPRGAVAQAWSVAEVLRAWRLSGTG